MLLIPAFSCAAVGRKCGLRCKHVCTMRRTCMQQTGLPGLTRLLETLQGAWCLPNQQSKKSKSIRLLLHKHLCPLLKSGNGFLQHKINCKSIWPHCQDSRTHSGAVKVHIQHCRLPRVKLFPVSQLNQRLNGCAWRGNFAACQCLIQHDT